jgi:hypothetical protein
MVSWVWNHFKKYGKDYSQCNYCGKKIRSKSSNTSGFIRHLRENHSITENEAKQRKFDVYVSKPEENTISLNRKQTIDKLIINYIIKKMVPLKTVEDKSFRDLIAFLEPSYQFMCYRSLKDKINDLFENRKIEIKNTFDKIASVSLDFDLWTSLANQSYITVNAHGITNDWKHVSHNLGTKLLEASHTSEYLKEKVDEVLAEFDIEFKTDFCVHDNGANMNLLSTLLGLTDIRCFAHNWDLAIKESLKVHEIENLINKCRKIVGHFNHSSIAKLLLEREQQKIGAQNWSLKQYVDTR